MLRLNKCPCVRFRCLSLLLLCPTLGLLALNSGCQFTNSVTSAFATTLPWQKPATDSPIVYEPTYNTYVSPKVPIRPRRIILIEAGPDRGNYGESKKMIEELTSKIRSAGLFEVITPKQTQYFSNIDTILQGRFDEREIAALARRHNADAIGFLKVNEIRGFSPLRIAVTLALVDSRETVVAYAIDGNWDTAHVPTQRAFQQFVSSQGDAMGATGSASLQLQSPRALMSFVGQQITDSLAGSIR